MQMNFFQKLELHNAIKHGSRSMNELESEVWSVHRDKNQQNRLFIGSYVLQPVDIIFWLLYVLLQDTPNVSVGGIPRKSEKNL
jgi:hypothetical protein